MSGFPWQIVTLAILIGVGYTAYQMMTRKGKVASYDQQYANYRVGQLAQRLGLSVVEGDPEFNLWITQANAEVAKGVSDKNPLHVQVRIAGQRGETPLELTYLRRVEQETDLTTITQKVWFDCRMAAQARQPFPPFEVVSRNAPMGPIAAVQPLPAQPTGDGQVDATYAVTTAEPKMAEVLGKLLPGFAVFVNSGIHLVGDGKTVSFRMQDKKAPLLANALYYAEQMADELVKVARAVGG